MLLFLGAESKNAQNNGTHCSPGLGQGRTFVIEALRVLRQHLYVKETTTLRSGNIKVCKI